MMKYYEIPFLLVICLVALSACNRKSENTSAVFTDIDSLTETYLILEDSMLSAWNEISGDEHEKIKALEALINAMIESQHHDKTQLLAMQARLDQLEEMKLTQASIEDPHAVDSYDFASNSLVSEIVAIAESDPAYASDKTLQEEVDMIKIADQHIAIYRADYDSVTMHFNMFLEKYKSKLHELDENLSRKKRPLFQ